MQKRKYQYILLYFWYSCRFLPLHTVVWGDSSATEGLICSISSFLLTTFPSNILGLHVLGLLLLHGLTCTWTLAFDSVLPYPSGVAALGFISECIPPDPSMKWTSDWLCLRNTCKGGRWVGPEHPCTGPGWPQGPKNGPRQCDQRELEERRT